MTEEITKSGNTPKAKKSGCCGGRLRFNLILNLILAGLVVGPFFAPPLVTFIG
jgi:hypothetical protein